MVAVLITALDFIISSEPNSLILIRGFGIEFICLLILGIYIGSKVYATFTDPDAVQVILDVASYVQNLYVQSNKDNKSRRSSTQAIVSTATANSTQLRNSAVRDRLTMRTQTHLRPSMTGGGVGTTRLSLKVPPPNETKE